MIVLSMTEVVRNPHESDGHAHETHGHRKTESKGIFFIKIYSLGFRLVSSMITVVFQCPITLRFMKVMALRLCLSMGREGQRKRSTEEESLIREVLLGNTVAKM